MTDVQTFINYYASSQQNESPWHVGTAEMYHREYDAADVLICDVRGREGNFKLDVHGFEFHPHISSEKNFASEDEIKSHYYDEVIALLKQK